MRSACIPSLGLLALLVAAGPATSATKYVRVTTPVLPSANVVAAAVAKPDSAVPVPVNLLPFVTGIAVCPSDGCDPPGRPICAGQQITVRIVG